MTDGMKDYNKVSFIMALELNMDLATSRLNDVEYC